MPCTGDSGFTGNIRASSFPRKTKQKGNIMAGVSLGEEFIKSIDPGLIVFKEELLKHAVTSESTLRYLRPNEVRGMNLPEVYKRMLCDRIMKLQTPESKAKIIEESRRSAESCSSPEPTSKRPKRLDFQSHVSDITNSDRPNSYHDQLSEDPSSKSSYMENELSRLKDERESLTILLVKKKNDLKDMICCTDTLEPLPVPGGVLTKTLCDKCHRKGHKVTGNRGGQSCPFDKCEGFSTCGILAKHREHKAEIQEAEKEIASFEKDIRVNHERMENIRTFLQTNTTNFVKMMKPRLQTAFTLKYKGKDGNQHLQKDIRFIKLATNGKIPENIKTIGADELTNLMKTGEKMLSTKYKLPVDDNDSNASFAVSKSDASACALPALDFSSPQPTYSPVQSPMMYPNYPYTHWQGMYQYNPVPYNYPMMWYGTPTNMNSTAAVPNVSSTVTNEVMNVDIFPPLPKEDSTTPSPPPPPPQD